MRTLQIEMCWGFYDLFKEESETDTSSERGALLTLYAFKSFASTMTLKDSATRLKQSFNRCDFK